MEEKEVRITVEKMDADRKSLCKNLEDWQISTKIMIMGDLLKQEKDNSNKFDSLIYMHFLLTSELNTRIIARTQVKEIVKVSEENKN